MSLKFLVVDDSVTMRRIVAGIGYSEFLEAGYGKEAMGVLNTNDDITFVITRWNMPIFRG